MLSVELDVLKKAHNITDDELKQAIDDECVYLSQLEANQETSFQVRYVAALNEYRQLR